MKKNKITEILGHDVSWFVDAKSVTELDECSIEHIENLIKEGYSSGELNVVHGAKHDKETRGWWHIINWRDIACGLYHIAKCATVPATEKEAVQKAVAKFDEEWTF